MASHAKLSAINHVARGGQGIEVTSYALRYTQQRTWGKRKQADTNYCSRLLRRMKRLREHTVWLLGLLLALEDQQERRLLRRLVLVPSAQPSLAGAISHDGTLRSHESVTANASTSASTSSAWPRNGEKWAKALFIALGREVLRRAPRVRMCGRGPRRAISDISPLSPR